MEESTASRKSRVPKVDIPTLITELTKKNVTKYRIAKTLGVSWQTVHAWHRGFYVPSETHETELLKLR